jgi:hypothetical protein
VVSVGTKTKTGQKNRTAKVSAAARTEKVAGLVAEIADKAAELASGEGWQRMLTGAAAGLWRYSLNK